MTEGSSSSTTAFDTSKPHASLANNTNGVSTLPPPPNHLTSHQVDELIDTVFREQSLQGRNVLIPLSEYAFVPGQLQPTKSKTATTQEELVYVATTPPFQQRRQSSGTETPQLAELTTDQAKEWLQQCASRKPVSKATTNGATKATKTSTSKSKPVSKNNKPKTAGKTPQPAMSSPFVDIQEEYDEEGKSISANVVDMNQRLEALWKLNENNDNGETKEGGEMPPPPSSSSSSASKNWMDTIVMDSGTSTTEDTANEEVVIEEESARRRLPQDITDQEYEQLSQRLEQLARLEEKAAMNGNKAGNKVTSNNSSSTNNNKAKKDGGGGWKKGFLNSSSSNKKANSSTKTAASPSAKIVAAASSPSNKQQDEPTASPASRKTSSVQFNTEQNQLQEIPRVGTQTLPPKQQQDASVLERPLEDSIFSGVIQERPSSLMEVGINERHAAGTTGPNMRSKANSSRFASSRQGTDKKNNGQDKPKRKSRFAQERHGIR